MIYNCRSDRRRCDELREPKPTDTLLRTADDVYGAALNLYEIANGDESDMQWLSSLTLTLDEAMGDERNAEFLRPVLMSCGFHTIDTDEAVMRALGSVIAALRTLETFRRGDTGALIDFCRALGDALLAAWQPIKPRYLSG